MRHLDEHKRTRAACLVFDAVDAGHPTDLRAGVQRLEELQPAACPHATRKVHRRKESTPLRMAVCPDVRPPLAGQEVEPMPERTQRLPGGIVPEEDPGWPPSDAEALR